MSESKPFVRSRTRTLKDGSTRIYSEEVMNVKVKGKWTQKFIRHIGTIAIIKGKRGRYLAEVLKGGVSDAKTPKNTAK